MHKANTYYEEEQPYSFEDPYQNLTEKPPTETEKKALHFFETGTIIHLFSFLVRHDLKGVLKYGHSQWNFIV